jgi:NAD-dependent dihydropyrimidine dehydrogenase PreA subunit
LGTFGKLFALPRHVTSARMARFASEMTRLTLKGTPMSVPVVDSNLCTACGICVDECPSGCYDLEAVAVLARPDDCTECSICVDACPNGSISEG